MWLCMMFGRIWTCFKKGLKVPQTEGGAGGGGGMQTNKKGQIWMRTNTFICDCLHFKCAWSTSNVMQNVVDHIFFEWTQINVRKCDQSHFQCDWSKKNVNDHAKMSWWTHLMCFWHIKCVPVTFKCHQSQNLLHRWDSLNLVKVSL